MYRIVILTFCWFLACIPVKGSSEVFYSESKAGSDTLITETIAYTPESASEYIEKLIVRENLWRIPGDTLYISLRRLIDHYNEPFDSVKNRLENFHYDSVKIGPSLIFHHDTLALRWLNDTLFFVDTVPLEKEPFIIQKTIVMNVMDTFALPFMDRLPDARVQIDSLLKVRDTITEVFIDFAYLESKNIRTHRVSDDSIKPPLLPPGSRKSFRFLEDSSKVVITESYRVLMADQQSPFYIVPDEKMPDSLRYAVATLLDHTYERDSVLLFFSDIDGRRTPFWLTTRNDDMVRYWVKNQENDSITIWLGNPTKFDITLILEEDVYVERLEKKPSDDIPIITIQPQRKLAKLQPLEEIPVYWNYGFQSSFTLNQNYLSNWARGGESSFSSMLDIRGRADYTKRATKEQWTNSGRLRYGTVRTKEHGFRTNADMIELNSQYNRVLREKLDFSTSFYGKTQVARGYNYPNDSVAVSKFLNPGTFTIGVGVEYKPFKDTRINFSPLSYRNTFVLDTAAINQTAHGIESGKRARQEMGGQLVIRNSFSIMDGLDVTNAIRLFSSYLDKPQNVDVDWEMGLEKEINWYFTIRLNLHLIYDDDIKFPVLDNAGEPVLLPDGTPRKAAKPQFNQFLG
ncbi:MAG: DUF3078 domain-containing protein, partial [Bacteroidetes bacterium]